MRIRTPKEKRKLMLKTAVRWIIYLIVIFFCFCLMTSGTLRKPVLLIPVAICISANTGELQASFTGAFCGLLIDIACGKLFGYNAFFLTIVCMLTSLFFINYLRQRFVNVLIITAVSSFILGYLDFRFYYDMWNYENADKLFSGITVPVFAYTVISAVPVYLVISLINKFLMPKRHLSIEEAIKTNQE